MKAALDLLRAAEQRWASACGHALRLSRNPDEPLDLELHIGGRVFHFGLSDLDEPVDAAAMDEMDAQIRAWASTHDINPDIEPPLYDDGPGREPWQRAASPNSASIDLDQGPDLPGAGAPVQFGD